MRRTPITDRPDDYLEDESAGAWTVRRVSTPSADQPGGLRADPRYRRGNRRSSRPPTQRGPSARSWLLRAVLGLCTLGVLWFALQLAFPVGEPRTPEPKTKVQTTVPSEVGAPEPPAITAQQPAATLVAQPTVEPVGDRLPGLSGQVTKPIGADQAATSAQQSGGQQPPAIAQQVGPGTPAPIPPAEGTPATTGADSSQPPRPTASLPPAPPPAPGGTNGPLQLRATASPANPISDSAVVTIGINLTSSGAPVNGASCMSTVYFRTATIRQPMGGVSTGANGSASFSIDAKGATFDRYVPVDVTCTTRQGSVTARTGFTPIRGR